MKKVQLINKENNKVILKSQPLDGKMCGECLRNIIIQVKDSNTFGDLVKIKDDKGNFRSMSEIFNHIKRIWKITKEEDQDKILKQMVGKENINKFKSIFEYGLDKEGV